jgi:8-oxo-dGTP pyrophosphatase MutT (NUDIX family)
MLDTTVAGAMTVGEGAWDCLAREAEEEASLDPALVRDHARSCGTVMYFGISDGRPEKGGGEEGLLLPECGFVFELELEEGVLPKPRDGEVEEFYCWTVEEVKMALMKGEYKTNCAAVMLDWLVRHEQLGDEIELHVEIEQRVRRKLEFPLI